MAEKNQKELGGQRMSKGTKVVIAIFAIIMALSMMLPSLAPIFAGGQSSSEQEEAQTDADATSESGKDESSTEKEDGDKSDSDAAEDDSKGDEAKDADASKDGEEDAKSKESDATKGVPDNDTLKSLAEQYADKVARYDERLGEDPDNLAALLHAGQAYMNWGYSAVRSSASEEESSYSKDLLKKAIDYFDRYLALDDSTAVKVDQALCSYYMDEADDAIKKLEKVAADDKDSPLAWANLGMLYESQYETDKASECYRKAVEADPNDEYGVKSYASQRLISINSTVSSPADAGDASADNVSTKFETGLTSTLKDDTGLGF